ncbi:ABC transporter permease [Flavobacterium silvaticum]|uniref:ABC transporter permease n=1 Tax=Flavobacterium silvaticum TaxID=1852020 RepID=A0A972JIB0_9FLAO|nr:ABC transporter permease [Flavobacterium silvaticum]NMH27117.1 ABC transporter permease [Flavobacterium silvaticum]
MFNLERWQEIFQAISKNKLRTFLTGISVASGIFILVILLGVGKGLQNGIQSQFERDATGLIEVWANSTTKEYKGLNPGRQIQMHNADYDMALHKFNDQIVLKSPSVSLWSAMIAYKKETNNYGVRGITSDRQFLENVTVTQGRFINDNDVRNIEKVGVIGESMRLVIFKDKPCIGEVLTVNGIPFKIVGVYTDPGGEREESRIYIPYTTIQSVFGMGTQVHNMQFTLKKKDTYDEALADVNSFTKGLGDMLRAKNQVAPDDEGAIGINSQMEEVKKFYDLNLYIRLFFWWVGICTIIAGVVGVSNIMLIIVKERTKEIGIRKALGASPWSIVTMILHESIFITTIAGFVGLLASLILLELGGPMMQSDFFKNPEVDFNVAVTTLILLVIAGAIAGFFPAWRAARIKPIVALREE